MQQQRGSRRHGGVATEHIGQETGAEAVARAGAHSVGLRHAVGPHDMESTLGRDRWLWAEDGRGAFPLHPSAMTPPL